jgi:hypothetical protein
MAEKWYLYQDGQQVGPFSWEDLYQKAASRTLKPDDMVWNQDMTGWTRAAAIPELLPQQPAAPPQLKVNQNTPPNYQQQNTIPPQQTGASQLPPRGSYSQKPPQNYEPAGPFTQEKKGGQGCFIFLSVIIILLVIGLGVAYYLLR